MQLQHQKWHQRAFVFQHRCLFPISLSSLRGLSSSYLPIVLQQLGLLLCPALQRLSRLFQRLFRQLSRILRLLLLLRPGPSLFERRSFRRAHFSFLRISSLLAVPWLFLVLPGLWRRPPSVLSRLFPNRCRFQFSPQRALLLFLSSSLQLLSIPPSSLQSPFLLFALLP